MYVLETVLINMDLEYNLLDILQKPIENDGCGCSLDLQSSTITPDPKI